MRKDEDWKPGREWETRAETGIEGEGVGRGVGGERKASDSSAFTGYHMFSGGTLYPQYRILRLFIFSFCFLYLSHVYPNSHSVVIEDRHSCLSPRLFFNGIPVLFYSLPSSTVVLKRHLKDGQIFHMTTSSFHEVDRSCSYGNQLWRERKMKGEFREQL